MLIYPKIRMASHLACLGHQVTWVVSSRHGDESQRFRRDEVEVRTIPYRHVFPGTSILAKAFNRIPHFFFKVRSILSVVRERQYDLLVVQPDVYDLLVATYIKKRYRIPVVLDLPNPVETVGMRHDSFSHFLVTKCKEFAIKRLLSQADLILVISTLLKDDLVSRKGIPETRIMVVPEGVNHELFSSGDDVQGMERSRLSEHGVVIYQGTLSKHRRLSLLIEAFHQVKAKRAGVKLLIVGDGDDERNLRDRVQSLGMGGDVVFAGHVPQSEVPQLIATADIGVSPVPPLDFYRFSSPTKVFEYMAMGKPVVANREIPEQEQVLEQSGGGTLVSYASDAFADAIIGLLDDPQRAAEMGRLGKEWVIKHRSHDVMARQLEMRYLELVRRRRKPADA